MERKSVKILFGNGRWVHCVAIETALSLEIYEIARDSRLKSATSWTRIFPGLNFAHFSEAAELMYQPLKIVKTIPLSSQNVHDIKLDRIQSLKDDVIDDEMAKQYYGINDKTIELIRRWHSSQNPEFTLLTPLTRSIIDRYLTKFNRISIRNAGFQLGMSDASFRHILKHIQGNFPGMSFFDLKTGLIESKYRHSIAGCFGADDAIGDLNDLNDYLHERIKQEIGFDVQKEYCFISRIFDGASKQYPYCYDAVLFRPISLKYSIPIRTNRPQMFTEDRISWYSFLLFEKEFNNSLWLAPNIDQTIKSDIEKWWSDGIH